jgi:hypothetical protein
MKGIIDLSIVMAVESFLGQIGRPSRFYRACGFDRRGLRFFALIEEVVETILMPEECLPFVQGTVGDRFHECLVPFEVEGLAAGMAEGLLEGS